MKRRGIKGERTDYVDGGKERSANQDFQIREGVAKTWQTFPP